MPDADRLRRRLLVDGAFSCLFTAVMLMEADLPDDVEALRALVLEQARQLDALKDFQAEAVTASAAVPSNSIPISSSLLWRKSRRHWPRRIH